MDILSFDAQAPDTSGHHTLPQPTQWITVEDAAALLQAAGLPRNNRTIRRYCTRGDLDCRKTENALHQPQYFIDVGSIETYIAQQRTLMSSGLDGPGRVLLQPDDAGVDAPETSISAVSHLAAPKNEENTVSPEVTGWNRTGPSGELFDQLQARLADKDEEIKFLRSELQHRRTTDTALHDVIAAFRANAESQRLAAGPTGDGQGTTHAHSPAQ